MKSKLFVLLLVVSMLTLVIAEDMPSTGIGVGDAEKIQKAIDDYSPLNESGKIDYDKYKPFKSKAEERIDKINEWLVSNASWMKVIFGMVPSISWLFAINFYILLFFIVTLIFNAEGFFGMFESLNQKIDLLFFEVSWVKLLGFAVFLLLLISKVFVKLANFVFDTIEIFWNYVLPGGLAAAVIAMVLVAIVFILLLIFAPKILIAIKKWFDERRKKKEAEKEAVNRKALDITVNKMLGQS